MGLLGWLERKVFTGEVVRDYGLLDEKSVGGGRLRTSVLLCRRNCQLRLVFRTVGTTALSANVSYAMIDATPDALSKLAEIVSDARREASTASPRSDGEQIGP